MIAHRCWPDDVVNIEMNSHTQTETETGTHILRLVVSPLTLVRVLNYVWSYGQTLTELILNEPHRIVQGAHVFSAHTYV